MAREPSRSANGRHTRHISPAELPLGNEGHPVPLEEIDNRQRPYARTIRQRVVHEIHRQPLVRSREGRPPLLQRQPLLGLQPVHSLAIDGSALAPQEHVQSQIPVAHPALG
jgi:hypothetical protein